MPIGAGEMAHDVKTIRDLLWPVVERELGGPKIVALNIRPELDRDGDPVLFITVVFDDRMKDIHPKALTGMVRKVRPTLLKAGEKSFPVFTYVGRSELGKIKPDAA
jgi:hypothetical protein